MGAAGPGMFDQPRATATPKTHTRVRHEGKVASIHKSAAAAAAAEATTTTRRKPHCAGNQVHAISTHSAG